MTSSTELQQTRPANDSPFARFANQQTVLLTTFRRDGIPVGTPMSVAVEGDRAFFRTWESAGKLKRIRHRARLLTGTESDRARALLSRKHSLLHGLLVPLIRRLRGNKTVHLALTPIAA